MFPASTGMHLRRTDVKDGTGVGGGGGALTEYLLQPVRGRQPPVRRLIAGTL